MSHSKTSPRFLVRGLRFGGVFWVGEKEKLRNKNLGIFKLKKLRNLKLRKLNSNAISKS